MRSLSVVAVAVLSACAAVALPRDARAWGLSPPVGPTGLRYCDGGDDEERPWRLGAAYGFSWTRLSLSGGGVSGDADFTKQSVSASLEHRVGDRWVLGGLVGSTTVGQLSAGGTTYTLSPGPLAGLAASFRAVDEGDIAPFVLFSFSLGGGVAWTSPGNQTLTALDGRLGVAAGKTFARVVTPYVLARAFGLPVLWTGPAGSVTGTDAYHYQVGAGLSVHVGRFDALVEGAPLGERALVVGVGLAL